jgi:LacI family transcriptional regulator
MKKKDRTRTLLYCSGFTAHRTHRTLVHFANQRGWDVLHAHWHEQSVPELIAGTRIDGIISHLAGNATKQMLTTTAGIPHVTLSAQTAREMSIPGVVLNHQAAGRIIAKHLIELGFTHIAAFGHKQTNATFNERIAGATEITSAAGLAPPMQLSWPEKNPTTFAQTMNFYASVLEKWPKPLAIIALHDSIAITLMHACRRCGFSIPSQVAIGSFDNDTMFNELAPIPLSSVEINFEEQATQAATLLASLMDGQAPPSSTIVIEPAGMIVRRSTGIVASANNTLAKALAYIHKHAWQNDLNLPEIAHAIGITNRTLFILFKRELAITPLQYLTDLRIKKAQTLMSETDAPINKIFPQCGFATYYQMHQAFKRTTGFSPGHFKR